MCEWRTKAKSPTASSAPLPGAVGLREGSGMADGDEVEGLVKAGVSQGEVRRGDRGDEAVVERLGDTQRRVDAVPAKADRELVGAQLAGMEQADDFNPREARLDQLAVFVDRVLAQVPRVLGLLRAGRSQGEAVGRRDIGDRRQLG